MRSDEELMMALQAGDERALGLLMERFQGPLYGFLLRRVGDAADDVFQESWIRVVRARDRFDPSRRFSTWLFQIANNLCRDRHRRVSARQRALDAFRVEDATVRPEPPAPEPREDSMREVVLSLPDRLREVLVLRYYEDLDEAEMARVLRIPRGTVKSRLHAAVRALKAKLEAGAGDA